MKYRKLNIFIGGEEAEGMLAELMEMGVASAEIVDSGTIDEIEGNRELYKWDYLDEEMVKKGKLEDDHVTIYCENSEEGRTMEDRVMKFLFSNFKDAHIEIQEVDDEDWKYKYKEDFKPLDLAGGLKVIPSWNDDQKVDSRYRIDLDPGMAFGTGGHETTSICVELMNEFGCNGKCILDVGAGSGILSICGAKLGAAEVLAVEIDENVVEVASENVKINQVDDVVRVEKGDLLEGVDFSAHIIVANLVAELVVQLIPQALNLLEEGGCMIVSGILNEKKDMVLDAYGEAGFMADKVAIDGDWVGIRFIHKEKE